MAQAEPALEIMKFTQYIPEGFFFFLLQSSL
jgi:hypothetical protein